MNSNKLNSQNCWSFSEISLDKSAKINDGSKSNRESMSIII